MPILIGMMAILIGDPPISIGAMEIPISRPPTLIDMAETLICDPLISATGYETERRRRSWTRAAAASPRTRNTSIAGPRVGTSTKPP